MSRLLVFGTLFVVAIVAFVATRKREPLDRFGITIGICLLYGFVAFIWFLWLNGSD